MNMNGFRRAALVATAFGFAMATGAETFRYKFVEGDSYRINSTVIESVYRDRALSHKAEITNRITVTVSDIRAAGTAGGSARASAKYDCTFMTSEKNTHNTFEWGREYRSVFRRDDLGAYDIGEEYFMPVVRNVPAFVEKDIPVGGSWTAPGEEAYDLRDLFGVKDPFHVPITVTYTYVGPVERDGKRLHKIMAEYSTFFETPDVPDGAGTGETGDYPVSTMEYSKQTLYWDNDLGLLPYYQDEFRIQIELSSGERWEYRGTSEATVTETKLMDREQMAKDMNKEIGRLGIKDTTAAATDEGVTITLENIQFEADSANLLPSEKEKINKIAALLERYPDKELLISGHTALAGTPEARQKLSEERASAVAKFLTDMGVRERYNVYARGFGADKPLVPNTSEANRARNRRVEITILEK
jgi:outer membrane protein OmpA-like peptidoglycan-associated protein